jgi:hypothetical protein
MRKILFIFVPCCPCMIFGQDFRKVSWKMSKDEVQKIETADNKGKIHDDTLDYQVSINDYDFDLQYLFTQSDKLYAASYYRQFVDNSYMNSYLSQKSFLLKMKDELDLKYGNSILINKDDDILFFYDTKMKRIKKYVNYDIDDFLDENESTNSVDYKNFAQNIFNIGYIYCLKYITDKTIICLYVQQEGENIHQEIMYSEKSAYEYMNQEIKKEVIKNSDL